MNKNYLIIGILAVVIIALCCAIGYVLLTPQTNYITTTIAESGTVMEIPDDMKVVSNNSGITTLEDENTIVIVFNSQGKGISELMTYATVKNPIFGNNYNGNLSIDNPNIDGCSLDGKCNAVLIGNNQTHDNIIVISKNPDIVNHIINSIQWGNKTTATAESASDDSSQSSTSEPSAYAYKSDGTPMYSQEEVDEYMANKYGLVDYHVKENGYIDMDEPGYDNAGNPTG